MGSRGTRTILTGAVIAALAASLALAAIDPDDYRLRQKDALLPAETETVVTKRCPRRHRAAPAGAFIHREGQRAPEADLALNGAVSSSLPIRKGRAWRVGAFKGPGEDQRVHMNVLCAPRAQVAGAKLVRERFALANGLAGGGTADCPSRTRVYSGGVLWHEPKSRDPVSAMVRTSSSSPVRTRRGWYGDGYNFSGRELVLDVVALCLPKRALADVEQKSADVPFPAYSEGFARSVRCRRGTRILTGGASWHRAGQAPDPDQAFGTTVSSSAPARNAKRWYANAVNFIGPDDARLRITVLCIPRGG